jgi:hypothetical protein
VWSAECERAIKETLSFLQAQKGSAKNDTGRTAIQHKKKDILKTDTT